MLSNPALTMKYDLIVIGGGSGGLVAAAGAAKLGARVALVEKNKLGGECLWTGCVPSKALIHSAKIAHSVETAHEYGLGKHKNKLNFPIVINRVQRVIKAIQPHDSPERFRKMGVDVIFGNPSFVDKHTLAVGKKTLKARKFIIATGSRPYDLPIKGLKEAGYLTNETIFTHKIFPKTFLIIGGGPIGAEMAQAYARLGSNVYLFERGPHILSKEDPEASKVIERVFKREGITVLKNMDITKVNKKSGKKVIQYKQNGKNKNVIGDEILLAVGRAPNIEGLNLAGIGVEHDKRKVPVNQKMQTSVANIYAIGDVAGGYLFTHTASYEATIALRNALFPFSSRADYSVVPWATFTDPEVARVGVTEADVKEQGIEHYVLNKPFKDADRAQAEGETNGFAKIITDTKGRILGVTIVGANAGELLPEFVLAMKNNLKITDIVNAIHVYPTLAEIGKAAGTQYYEKKLTPLVKKIIKFIIRTF